MIRGWSQPENMWIKWKSVIADASSGKLQPEEQQLLRPVSFVAPDFSKSVGRRQAVSHRPSRLRRILKSGTTELESDVTYEAIGFQSGMIPLPLINGNLGSWPSFGCFLQPLSVLLKQKHFPLVHLLSVLSTPWRTPPDSRYLQLWWVWGLIPSLFCQ